MNVATSNYATWHAHLGHFGWKNLLLLQKQSGGKIATADLEPPSGLCEPCQLSKQTRNPHTPSATIDNDDTVHVDLTGLYPTSIHGNWYALTYFGPKRLARGYFLPSKETTGTRGALEDLLPFFEKNGWNIRVHCSDRGGEFLGEDYVNELQHRGIRIETTIRDTPQQNGIAGRSGVIHHDSWQPTAEALG